jgi:formamidopyrimidine-DNA glycosylase
MPELPEVETTCRGITPHILHKTVARFIVRRPTLRWPIPPNLSELLTDQHVTAVERRGKYILLRIATGTLILHLGMSGVLRIVRNNTLAAKHDHIDIQLTDGTCLRFSDPRRFGCVLWTDEDPLQHALLKKLAPEPLSTAFDADYLFTKSRKKAISSKQFLMNNHHVVGVGNIYANEALFAASVSPKRAAGKLTAIECEKLVTAIKNVLRKAIRFGGTTLKDFTNSDGKPGYFRNQLQVYGQGGEPCPTCGTKFKELRQGGRATVYCSTCQK